MIYDFIIVGGGMVGATLACALKDKRIALIDSTPHSPKEDPRLIALNFGSVTLLKNIGLMDELNAQATPIKQIHVSHQGHFGITRIHANELDLPHLGQLIPAKFINGALDKQLSTLSNVDIFRPFTLKTLSQTETLVTVTLQKDNETLTLQAKKLIGADGTHSTVRELLNIPIETTDYDQSAIVTIIQLKRAHQNMAYERFTAQGAIAMLPMKDNQVAMIWTENNKTVTELMQQEDKNFLTQAQKQFGYRLGKFISVQKRYTFPLKSILTNTNQKQNIFLIGNAAHTIHPIAAQGLNLALQEIAEFCETGNVQNQFTLNKKLSHHLNAIFSTDFFLLNHARKLGLLGLDISLHAKQFFMKKAMGRSGRLPTLLQDREDGI